MGRGNAAQRAAKIKEQLQVASEEQAKIAEQAITAVEGGVDPKVAADLAVAAANEIDVLKETTAVLEDQEAERRKPPVKNASESGIVKIRTKYRRGGKIIFSIEDNIFQLEFDTIGETKTTQDIADYLVSPDSDYEFCE